MKPISLKTKVSSSFKRGADRNKSVLDVLCENCSNMCKASADDVYNGVVSLCPKCKKNAKSDGDTVVST